MSSLRMGSDGKAVTELQQRLRKFAPELATDGHFGRRTERAVRLAQRRLALFPPDGIAGPRTMAALASSEQSRGGIGSQPGMVASGLAAASRFGQAVQQFELGVVSWIGQQLSGLAAVPPSLRPSVAPALTRAQNGPMPEGVVTPVGAMRMSNKGRLFIIRHEGQRGVSNHLHHPSMGSGVTIGPGYDMKDRTRVQVANDLKAVLVDPAVAELVAQGAGLHGQAARDFARQNKMAINLSDGQQAALLAQIIGHYESMVRSAIRVPLHQYEFDALVSYAYNPGGGWNRTTQLVNAGKPREAMEELSRHVFSKGERIHSLVVRRQAETSMFIYGEYN